MAFRPSREEIKAFQRGEEDAVALFYDRLTPMMLYHAYKYGFTTDDAEDVVQEAFMHLYEVRNAYDDRHGASFFTWSFTVTRNYLVSIAKKRSSEDRRITNATADIERAPDEGGESQEYRDLLAHLAQILTPEEHDVLLYRTAMQLRAKEIAQIMGIDASRVYALYHSAIVKARKDLKR